MIVYPLTANRKQAVNNIQTVTVQDANGKIVAFARVKLPSMHKKPTIVYRDTDEAEELFNLNPETVRETKGKAFNIHIAQADGPMIGYLKIGGSLFKRDITLSDAIGTPIGTIIGEETGAAVRGAFFRHFIGGVIGNIAGGTTRGKYRVDLRGEHAYTIQAQSSHVVRIDKHTPVSLVDEKLIVAGLPLFMAMAVVV